MKICYRCQEEFTDKVTKCPYCGGPVEIVSTPGKTTPDKSDKKDPRGVGYGEIWKNYKIAAAAIIILAAFIIFTLSQIVNSSKSAEDTMEIKPAQINAPAVPATINTPPTEPEAATANVPKLLPASESANNLLKKAFDLCHSGKCTDAQQAVEYLDEAIKLNPDLAEAYNNRGNAYSDLKEYQLAIEDYDEAIRLKSDYAHAYYNRGLAYTETGDHQRAIEDYEETLRLKPEETNAYYNRGNAYFIQGNKELGCIDAQKACELGNCRLLEKARKKKDCL
jgi:tetratricopeptide (TPR) repeat protein